jgi:ubiquinone/menaquinone biosynthesis C-methylase UbiE
MNKNKQIELIRRRYRERREGGLPGWADDTSYDRKIKNAQTLVKRYNIPQGARFLELGCGAGNVALHMAKLGFDSYGIDIAPEAIDWARSDAEKEGVKAVFTKGDVVSLVPYDDDFFDVVFDGDCLWMVIGDDRPERLANVFRILKPGGIFFAQAHIMCGEFKDSYEAGPGVIVDSVTFTSSVENIPMYQYSLNRKH